MNTPEILPTQWHRKPARNKQPCPICGFWKKDGLHRAIAPDENRKGKWLVRMSTDAGWKFYVTVMERVPKKRGPKPGSRPHIPTPRVAKLMGQAVGLVARGQTMPEVAQALNVRPSVVAGWQHVWRDTWNMLLSQAVESLATSVRAMAGTAAVFDDPTAYIKLGKRVLKSYRQAGRDLFPPANGTPTLTSFYREWYLPQKLFEASPGTLVMYDLVLRHWQLITGDPPVTEITDETVANFRDFLLKQRGIKVDSRKSVNTVRTQMGTIQTLLDKLGPPGPKNRDGRGLIQRVPWAQRPRKELKIPKTVSMEMLSRCYAAADRMTRPMVPNVGIADWWRALLVTDYNTGMRAGTLFGLRWEYVDLENARIVLPARYLKSRRPQVFHLNVITVAHLQRIRGGGDLVFPWPHKRRNFWQDFHRLQSRAGIPEAQWFGLHAIRRTLATTLWEVNPGAAQFALGHTGSDVTRQHYVDGGPMVARALDALPQPWASCAVDVLPEPVITTNPEPHRCGPTERNQSHE